MITVNNKCLRCGGCVAVCPQNALRLRKKIDCDDRCVECGICAKFCPVGAITINFSLEKKTLMKRNILQRYKVQRKENVGDNK
jgi:ferredoxin